MPSLTVRLPDADLQFLKAEAVRQNRDVSYVVRELIQVAQAPPVGPESQQVVRAGMVAHHLGLRTQQVVKMAVDVGLDILDSRPLPAGNPMTPSEEILISNLLKAQKSSADSLRLNMDAPKPEDTK
jgi:hypothetical protein